MRNFYIFQIQKDMEPTLKKNPYELFHTLQTIYYEKNPSDLQFHLVRQLIEKMDIKTMDIEIFKALKENYFYTKYKSIHSMHDVYRKENSVLILHPTYLNLKTDAIQPCFFEELKKYRRLFFCDFEKLDYFWLDSLKEASLT
ncbi:MAG: sporulation inhibitor of replication protein SirA [Bacilli bacterium]|nr:sporulation inhibitor of replication protein SirA [Bacilli bacterium]